jgi:hypothetical protein
MVSVASDEEILDNKAPMMNELADKIAKKLKSK